MWRRFFDDRRLWAGAVLLGVVLFLVEIAFVIFGGGSTVSHLLRSLIWVALTPIWFDRYRKATRRSS